MNAFPDRADATPRGACDPSALDAAWAWARSCNRTERPFPRDAGIDELFFAQAARAPDAVAVIDDAGECTYGQLARQARAVAAWLQAAGLQAEERVGVALDRGRDVVSALIGVLAAGGAYVPLDAALPATRLSHILRDTGARIVLADPAHATQIDAVRPSVPNLAVVKDPSDLSPAAGDGWAHVTVDGRAARLAYVIYTSGTTGVPKGVMVDHRAIARLVLGTDFLQLGPTDRVLMTGALSFDACTFEIWGPLLNGGAVCRPSGRTALDARAIADRIGRHGITTMWLTATLCNHYIDNDVGLFAGLSTLLTGGEKLSAPHIARLRSAHPGLRVINGYGPTENTTFTCCHRVEPGDPLDPSQDVPIGRPIANTTVWILDDEMRPVPAGSVGELWTGGDGVARGYLNDPVLTTERFRAHPDLGGARLYRTGDLARWRDDGAIEYCGRVDQQVKIRGFRIELSEVELALSSHPGVRACAVVARESQGGTERRLVAYVVAAAVDGASDVESWRRHLAERLPDYMVPASFVALERLPLTVNGKLDRQALPEPPLQRPPLAVAFRKPVSEHECQLCEAFEAVLGLTGVGADDNFFDLGGTSLALLRVQSRLRSEGVQLDATAFFRHPTPAALARELAPQVDHADGRRHARRAVVQGNGLAHRGEPGAVAIVAASVRLPGAGNLETFWQNLCDGVESIRRFADHELDPAVPASLRDDPAYVKARGVVDGIDRFDAAFFGISPREAALMDPQQRLLLELSWECLERGGYAPDATPGPVGVFAGVNNATYFQRHLLPQPEQIASLGEFQVMLANEKDFVATRVAHKLDLTGPAISIHTACSTSLVAVAQAVWSLRERQCDMALAGGVSLTCPPSSGYLYQEGAMLSPDGHTRSFAAGAQGTVFSDGAAVLLLKRLDDAVADGDQVIAVIRGVAVNNDGGAKASFTAPSVDGQAAVISAALADAQVDARSLSYVEAHGTATPLGDPVEVEGLRRAFGPTDGAGGWCGLGSVKSNFGHTVIAAGATGLLKTALALQHETLPATLHHDAPHPAIDFASSPFRVVARSEPWPRTATPRRAGVSSFGVGGTNAHVVVEEAPALEALPASTGPHLLIWSARTPSQREAQRERLAAHLAASPTLDLADVAHTLQVGRKAFTYRGCAVVDGHADAQAVLSADASPWRADGRQPAASTPVAMLFPGQGAQYAGMGSGLRDADPLFRVAFEEALNALEPHVGVDLRAALRSTDSDALRPTIATQPATFALEYALARSWIERGLKPVALIGHSVGEFAAAVIAGVMTLADAARLVARRAALMQAQPAGAMLAVRLPASQAEAACIDGVSLAAINGPGACVLSGPADRIDACEREFASRGVLARRLQTSHAFHSSMMDGAVGPFAAEVAKASLRAPQAPIVSTLTGQLLTEREACDPQYWAHHLRDTVRFSMAWTSAASQWPGLAALEVGPRASLAAFVRQHAVGAAVPTAIASLTDRPDDESRSLLLAAGRLWTLGAALDLTLFRAPNRRRVRLPTYPFERQRHWIDAPPAVSGRAPASRSTDTPLTSTSHAATAEATPSSSPFAMVDTPRSAPADRQPALRQRLRTLFEDISGLDLAASPDIDDLAFVELGLDSLTLTQAALQVKKQFGVALSFRQLMESLRSFSALAAHLDQVLPAEPEAAVAATQVGAQPVVPAAPLSLPATLVPAVLPASIAPALHGSALHSLIQQQMQLMAQQLALLGAPGAAVATVAPTTAAVDAATAPPTAVSSDAPQTPPVAASRTDPEAETAAPVRYDVKKAFGAIARIHTQGGALTERQQARVAAFVRRYVERTRRSKEYTVEHRSHLADPRVVNGFRPATKEITYQVVIERSKGAHLWDLDGNEYVDVLNGFGMNLFGWQPDFIQDAVRRQLELGYEIGPQHVLAGDVARLVCELTGFDRAGLCNTGSEAVMAAVRIARTVTGRSTVVLFTGSYHGTFDEVLVRAGKQHKGLPAAPGIMAGVFGDVRVLDYGTPEALAFIRDHADDLAAVLVEPVQSRRPDFQPREFLKEVREITERSGTCLIFDEVITGFRAHLGGTQAMFGIRADLASYGKVIGGGMPIGVVAGRREYMDALDGGAWQYGDDSIPTVGVTYFAGTFVRHPLALAAAKAALEHLKAAGPELQAKLNLHTAAMADELSAYCREVGAPLEIRHFGSLWRVSWLEDHPMQDLLFAMMRSRGVHILDNFPCFLTTAHTSDDIARIKTAFKESLAELQEAELLPRRAAAIVADPSNPPVPNARLGRDKDGTPTWFVPDPAVPGKYVKVGA